MFKAVVFDIDGTLTKDISWVRLTNELGGSVEFNDDVIKKWEDDDLSEKEAKEKLVQNWSRAGRGFKHEFLAILKNIPLREDARDLVDYLKNKGYLVTMITGSLDLYAEIVGENLGIQYWFANTTVTWDEAGKLLCVQTCKGSQAKNRKVDHLKVFCAQNNLKAEDCVVVGDSENDLALFELTSNGIVIRTEFEAPQLEAVAWKKVDSLSEIKEIL